jgi:hypothetical protein
MFQSVKVWHVHTTESDHCCLAIEFHEQVNQRQSGRRSFRYESMWRRDESYMKLVHDSWGDAESVSHMDQLQERMKTVRNFLQDWDVNVFGSVRRSLARLRSNLECIRRQSIGGGPL